MADAERNTQSGDEFAMTLAKSPPLRDLAYLKWQRTQRCLICGRKGDDQMSVVAAHIGTAGRGLKSSDSETMPLCDDDHRRAHTWGEIGFLRNNIPNTILREMIRAWCRMNYEIWKGEG